jgi:hypothetical protein
MNADVLKRHLIGFGVVPNGGICGFVQTEQAHLI